MHLSLRSLCDWNLIKSSYLSNFTACTELTWFDRWMSVTRSQSKSDAKARGGISKNRELENTAKKYPEVYDLTTPWCYNPHRHRHAPPRPSSNASNKSHGFVPQTLDSMTHEVVHKTPGLIYDGCTLLATCYKITKSKATLIRRLFPNS
jgi:hypothetical protein